MKFTFKNLFSFLLTGIVATTLVSCENEDECFSPPESFKLTLINVDGEDIYGGEEPAFNPENIRIYFINIDENEEEVEFNFQTQEEGPSYIESLSLSEESLAE
ncbi:hypothetical protein QWY93_01575 [Echinicola jeungdonensis]|uniref:Uncharacterized protein n=1 Tax=Echinicola jeungdonensis TaxID=709343 RepID=A0ABV5J7Z0_9BACT|nr:hypothetical protein [Echinicola jeungdonensis]MDN3668025.1 hypothetical protein [Echinicola jeungdonensis]